MQTRRTLYFLAVFSLILSSKSRAQNSNDQTEPKAGKISAITYPPAQNAETTPKPKPPIRSSLIQASAKKNVLKPVEAHAKITAEKIVVNESPPEKPAEKAIAPAAAELSVAPKTSPAKLTLPAEKIENTAVAVSSPVAAASISPAISPNPPATIEGPSSAISPSGASQPAEEEAVSLDGDSNSGSVANGEEAVADLSGTASNGPTFPNPYVFDRNHWWLLLPVGVLALLALHLIAYPYIRVKKVVGLRDLLPGDPNE